MFIGKYCGTGKCNVRRYRVDILLLLCVHFIGKYCGTGKCNVRKYRVDILLFVCVHGYRNVLWDREM
jgi:hypothetical protein